jgi:hypothetical protein
MSTLPVGLEATYRRLLDGMNKDDQVSACKILLWIDLAVSHPSLRQLAVILSCDDHGTFDVRDEPSLADIVDLCKGLATPDRDDEHVTPLTNGCELSGGDKLVFSHSSVRDWLRQMQSNAGVPHPILKRGHDMLAEHTALYILDYTSTRAQLSLEEFAEGLDSSSEESRHIGTTAYRIGAIMPGSGPLSLP